MNRVSKVTRRDVLDLFKSGLEMSILRETEIVQYNYFGQMGEIEFPKGLYDSRGLLSLDARYTNAEDDIRQHTVNNDDYLPCWMFEDERFQLKNGNDETYLRFLCEIFHPEVRDKEED